MNNTIDPETIQNLYILYIEQYLSYITTFTLSTSLDFGIIYTCDKPNTASYSPHDQNHISGNTSLATFTQIRHALSTYCIHVTGAQDSPFKLIPTNLLIQKT